MSENIDVIIYKPTKSAMQSGLATNKFWILKFNSKEEAIDYAELHSLNFRILNNNTKNIKPKSYADNFSFKRKGLWSH